MPSRSWVRESKYPIELIAVSLTAARADGPGFESARAVSINEVPL
jgi:hypothetical protein